MNLWVIHTTRYRYESMVTTSHNEMRLIPLSDTDQSCTQAHIGVQPSAPQFHYDMPSGRVHHVNIRTPHRELTIRMEARVATRLPDPVVGLDLYGEAGGFYGPERSADFCEWLFPTRRVPHDHPDVADELEALTRRARDAAEGPSPLAFLLALTRRIHQEFPYDSSATHVETTLEEVLSHHRRGVCQDFAHVMLAVCRREGIPARYVSGYLFTGLGLHSGDVMHAWIECLVPDAEGRPVWRGFDPTNDLMANDAYVKVHRGRDYGDVTPIRGVVQGGGASTLEVDVRVVDADATSFQSQSMPAPTPPRG